MKRRKLFEINYVLNSFLYLAMLCFEIVKTIIDDRSGGLIATLFFAIILFIVIVAPFNWACYILNKSHKNNLQPSNTADTAGIILGIFFNIVTVLTVMGIILYIHDFFIYHYDPGAGLIFYYFLYSGFTITSIYLSISYWIIRRQIKSQFTSTLSLLGEKDKN